MQHVGLRQANPHWSLTIVNPVLGLLHPLIHINVLASMEQGLH